MRCLRLFQRHESFVRDEANLKCFSRTQFYNRVRSSDKLKTVPITVSVSSSILIDRIVQISIFAIIRPQGYQLTRRPGIVTFQHYLNDW